MFWGSSQKGFTGGRAPGNPSCGSGQLDMEQLMPQPGLLPLIQRCRSGAEWEMLFPAASSALLEHPRCSTAAGRALGRCWGRAGHSSVGVKLDKTPNIPLVPSQELPQRPAELRLQGGKGRGNFCAGSNCREMSGEAAGEAAASLLLSIHPRGRAGCVSPGEKVLQERGVTGQGGTASN